MFDTLRLTGQLRFSFVHDADTNISRIVDRQKPDAITYAHKMDAPYTEVQEDYAIISRVWDPTTGKVVVTVAGLAKFGTAAAGEFLTTPSYMADLGKRLPKGWDRRNLQLVIAAPVIGHSSGTPRVVETFVW